MLCSTGEHVDATMKGPSDKGVLFAVLEYMDCGIAHTPLCRSSKKVSMCSCSAWYMTARRVS